jgi:hypothetical protein
MHRGDAMKQQAKTGKLRRNLRKLRKLDIKNRLARHYYDSCMDDHDEPPVSGTTAFSKLVVGHLPKTGDDPDYD